MPRYTATQLATLERIDAFMMTQVRAVMNDPDAGDRDAFTASWQRLRTEFGRPGAIHLIRGWLDQVVEASPTVQRGETVAVAFANADGTDIEDAGEQPLEYQWAAAALAARFRDDTVALYTLIDMLPDGNEFIGYLLRCAVICAGVLNSYEDRPDTVFAAGDVLNGHPIGAPG